MPCSCIHASPKTQAMAPLGAVLGAGSSQGKDFCTSWCRRAVWFSHQLYKPRKTNLGQDAVQKLAKQGCLNVGAQILACTPQEQHRISAVAVQDSLCSACHRQPESPQNREIPANMNFPTPFGGTSGKQACWASQAAAGLPFGFIRSKT